MSSCLLTRTMARETIGVALPVGCFYALPPPRTRAGFYKMKRGIYRHLNVKISKTNTKYPKKGFLFGEKGLIPFLRLSVLHTLNVRFCWLSPLLCKE
jgi:hypothetical protein